MTPLLSILTPSIPARLSGVGAGPWLEHLVLEIERQIGDDPRVEHLIFTDNKRRPVGAKRQALLEMARGEYVAFVDDDDWVSDDYLAELLPRCEAEPDVVTFEQDATHNGHRFKVIFNAALQRCEPYHPGVEVLHRRPYHMCAWRRALALQGVFTEINYGEDLAWVNQVAPLAKNTLHIPKVLHFYRHSAETTAAPPPG